MDRAGHAGAAAQRASARVSACPPRCRARPAQGHRPDPGTGSRHSPLPGCPSMTQPLPDHSLSDAVAERLRADIMSGVYAPGDRLVERRLAQRFGVSHIPLREALARLVEEGLVERLPRRGARVASLSPRMLEEISSLRVVLEQFVIRRVQGRFTPKARADLQAIVDRMTRAAKKQDLALVHELDQQFHEYL